MDRRNFFMFLGYTAVVASEPPTRNCKPAWHLMPQTRILLATRTRTPVKEKHARSRQFLLGIITL